MVSGGGEGWQTLNGITLHYQLWGNGPRPPIVLLHPATGQAADFEPLAIELARDRRVFALDQRGHGASDWATGRYSLEHYTADLRAFIDSLELAGCWVLGSSLGAAVGLALAARTPGLVQRLLLDDQPPELPPAHMQAPFSQTLALLDRPFASVGAAVEARAHVTGLARGEALQRAVAANLRRVDKGDYRWRWDPDVLRALGSASVDLWPDFQRVPCETLCLRGHNSRVLTRATWERMQSQRPDLQYQEVPMAAHTVAVTAPTAFRTIAGGWAAQPDVP